MEEPHMADNKVAKRFHSEQEWRYGAHDQNFVAGDAHVPEREVYNVSEKFDDQETHTYTTRIRPGTST